MSLEGDGADETPASSVAEEIRAAGGTARIDFGDVSDEAAAQATVDRAIGQFGRARQRVNKAGNFVPRGPFADTAAESFARIWRVHVMGRPIPCAPLGRT